MTLESALADSKSIVWSVCQWRIKKSVIVHYCLTLTDLIKKIFRLGPAKIHKTRHFEDILNLYIYTNYLALGANCKDSHYYTFSYIQPLYYVFVPPMNNEYKTPNSVM